jgi:hypothetical protein
MKASRIAVSLALTLWLPLAQPLAAAPAGSGAYQVEVLIFRAIDPPTGEDLRARAEGRGFNGQLERGAAPPAVLRTLDASRMQLGGMAARLRASGAWRVLAHAAWVQSATDWPRHAGLPLEQVGLNANGLTGNVYLERGQFLHLGFDLRLGSDPAWSLSELRKVKFNEKNYFDHPGFGVIALVSPAAHDAN